MSEATPIETFEGFVETMGRDVSQVRFTSTSGEVLFGECPTSKLIAMGIRERRRFECDVVECDGDAKIRLTPIPGIERSDEDRRATVDRIRGVLGDYVEGGK